MNDPRLKNFISASPIDGEANDKIAVAVVDLVKTLSVHKSKSTMRNWNRQERCEGHY